MTNPPVYAAFVAAWPNRYGEMVPSIRTMSRTAKEAREKAGDLWAGGWRYAQRQQGWRVVKINFQMPGEPS